MNKFLKVIIAVILVFILLIIVEIIIMNKRMAEPAINKIEKK
jgi:uncharacterized membrane protein